MDTHHQVTTPVCPCCNTARWYCPTCAKTGRWPCPTPAPDWPHQRLAACPRCEATITLRIVGPLPDEANVGALERCIRLPAARRPRRGFGAA